MTDAARLREILHARHPYWAPRTLDVMTQAYLKRSRLLAHESIIASIKGRVDELEKSLQEELARIRPVDD